MPEADALKLLAAGLAAGLGMLGPGIGIGNSGRRCNECNRTQTRKPVAQCRRT